MRGAPRAGRFVAGFETQNNSVISRVRRVAVFMVGNEIADSGQTVTPQLPLWCSGGASNTLSEVMHNRARRARPSSQREVVNNSATAQTGLSEQLAAAGTQTGASHPARVMTRTLTPPSARGPIAERTLPQEGRCIRSRPPREAGLRCRRSKPMKAWTELTHFAALDWADDHHDLVVVDAQGKVALELTF